jgi:hypothetical protein
MINERIILVTNPEGKRVLGDLSGWRIKLYIIVKK